MSTKPLDDRADAVLKGLGTMAKVLEEAQAAVARGDAKAVAACQSRFAQASHKMFVDAPPVIRELLADNARLKARVRDLEAELGT